MTNRRPTPLCHYLFPSGGEGLFLYVDEKAVVKPEAMEKARFERFFSPAHAFS
jgi:ATP-dependent RNA helicase DOB1